MHIVTTTSSTSQSDFESTYQRPSLQLNTRARNFQVNRSDHNSDIYHRNTTPAMSWYYSDIDSLHSDEDNHSYYDYVEEPCPIELLPFRDLVEAAEGYMDTQHEYPLYDAMIEFLAIAEATTGGIAYERELKFHRFLPLPAELRLKVYGHYLENARYGRTHGTWTSTCTLTTSVSRVGSGTGPRNLSSATASPGRSSQQQSTRPGSPLWLSQTSSSSASHHLHAAEDQVVRL
jgi:hypothetical protein